MTLATVNADGQPSARTVLLKEVTPEGFVFYTNYYSRKGNDIQDNDLVALLFWWSPMERQVRIEGKIKKYDNAASLAYFQSRPRESQIGAWASVQSSILPNRQFLEDKVKKVEQRFKGQDILPKPDSWGGYLVEPHRFEFWQGRPNRLHDRLCFSKSEKGGWTLQRLSP